MKRGNLMADLITDAMVLKTQQWLNKTYEGKTGYGSRDRKSTRLNSSH